jgi:hypothetical protein
VNNIIKFILAILFFLCLADMPYGFYQFVRFAGLIGFAILAYQANQQGRQTEMIIYGGLALLFQPFFKIALGRQMWNIVDCSCRNRTFNINIYETKGKPTLKASTFAIRTSQRTDQKLQKSLLCQRRQNCF